MLPGRLIRVGPVLCFLGVMADRLMLVVRVGLVRLARCVNRLNGILARTLRSTAGAS